MEFVGEAKGSCTLCTAVNVRKFYTATEREIGKKAGNYAKKCFSSILMYIDSIVSLKRKKNI